VLESTHLSSHQFSDISTQSFHCIYDAIAILLLYLSPILKRNVCIIILNVFLFYFYTKRSYSGISREQTLCYLSCKVQQKVLSIHPSTWAIPRIYNQKRCFFAFLKQQLSDVEEEEIHRVFFNLLQKFYCKVPILKPFLCSANRMFLVIVLPFPDFMFSALCSA